MGFGAYIRAQPEQANRPMNEFARALGISPAYWSRIERELEKPPKDELIAKAAELLGLNPDEAFVQSAAARHARRCAHRRASLPQGAGLKESLRVSALTLDYAQGRHGEPSYLTHEAVGEVAARARAQLLPAGEDALPLATLASLDQLRVNGLAYSLWVSLDHPITDEQRQPVLGLCEYDPGCGEEAISLLVAPLSERLSAPLALSTFAHELGHAIFDGPAWLLAARRGPGLFDTPTADSAGRRTLTRSASHLESTAPGPGHARLADAERLAKYRANEFMGALLVPRAALATFALAQADAFGVPVQRVPDLFADHSATGQLAATTAAERAGLERLVRALAEHFRVNPAFIRVRLQRYGLLAMTGR
jgi:transcriptional regulator with XRE-family HTH domain